MTEALSVAVAAVLLVGAVAAARRRRAAAPPPADDATAVFRLLFDSLPAPAWAFDEDSLRFVAVNDAVLRRFGYARDALLRLGLRDVCPDGDADLLVASPGGPIEWRHRCASGALLPLEVTTRRLVAGGQLLRLVVASDATDRRKAEGN